jgi:threonine synthase
MSQWQGVYREYREYLPEIKDEFIVTLNEGNTPLIKAVRIQEFVGFDLEIYFKFEGLNPTSSFKDRGMTVAVSVAKMNGAKAVICASTGNTSASAAAYAGRGGMKCYIIIPESKVALGKLSQAMIHGAEVIQIQGNFDDALNIVKELAANYPVTVVNSINPYRLEGQKTASFEICDRLGCAPTYHVLPVGNAGNIVAYWKGYKEYKSKGKITALPKMLGFQAEGAAPIVRNEIVKNPNTVASAIRIGNPASWKNAIKARDESGGLIEMVSDEEILTAYSAFARMEGIFCEPASAITVAGIKKLAKTGYFRKGDVLVCTLTGHGLKDPATALEVTEKPKVVPAQYKDVVRSLGF